MTYPKKIKKEVKRNLKRDTWDPRKLNYIQSFLYSNILFHKSITFRKTF